MTDADELLNLAVLLETNAHAATAKSRVHYNQGEHAEGDRERNRSVRGLHFAEVCRRSAKKLKGKEKRSGFVAPNFAELLSYTRDKHPEWPQDDVRSWWNYFESCGWRIGRGKPMVDWRRAADNGFRTWLDKRPRKAVEHKRETTDQDPEGYRSWLSSKGLPYREYRFQQPHIREAFSNKP